MRHTRTHRLILYYGALCLLELLYWFVTLFPINLRDPGFFRHLIILLALIALPWLGLRLKKDVFNARRQGARPFPVVGAPSWFNKARPVRSIVARRVLWLPLLLIVLYFVLQLTGAAVFRARDYANLIHKKDGVFKEDVAEIQFYDIPTVDRESAMRLGNKRMGEMADLVSQFDVADDYTQINYQGRPVRVTPLRYADLFKWFNNRGQGLPKLITVDLITSDVDLKPIPGGMKYSESEPLFRNIKRHLRLQYPTKIMAEPRFEIDDETTPYFVTPVLTPKVGWFGGRDVTEVILTNAVTGQSRCYPVADCPHWVDRVYPSELVLTQLNDNGRYQKGWLNSLIGQKGVLKTTAGYNYLALHDDVYLYTGITSVASDSSNLGFVLVNQRTKDTRFYPVSSADETSAMGSAEGAVQEKRYRSTFPILLNIAGRPTYCMALKDNAQLVKMYALVDAQNYQATAVGGSIREAISNYKSRLAAQLTHETNANAVVETKTARGVVISIEPLVIRGDTYYYFTIRGSKQIYSAAYTVSPHLPFIRPGQEIKVTYRKDDVGGLYIVDAIEVYGR